MEQTNRDERKYAEYIQVFEYHSGIMTLAQAVRAGIPKHIVYQMLHHGILSREEQGLYRLANQDPLGNPDLVQVSLRIPRAVVCCISALYYHGLTTQVPYEVHLALPRNYPRPRITYPPLEVYWLSGEAYASGMVEVLVDGVPVRIYCREKTLSDCFKFRNRLGLDIAIEGLKDYFKQPGTQIDELMTFARINRVQHIMLPYIKTLLT